MLKRRVIISLCINDGVLFRTKRFVPDYRYTTSYLAVDAVDEVFLVDITRGGPSAASRRGMAGYAERCFAPVTMGGWVRSLDDAKELFAIGADKIVIGRAGVACPPLFFALAQKYGRQALVAAVDVRSGALDASGNGPKTLSTPAEYAKFAQGVGAGEIFFQSIDRDGSLSGYDLAVLREIASAVGIPVVVGGGCGGWRHMAEGFAAGADGCVTSVIHHFTETSLAGFKRELLAAGIPVREAA